MRCLFCGLRKKTNSMKCQFCEYYLEAKEIRERLAYLENGFGRVNSELDSLEQKVYLVIGLVFKRHKYTVEDLLDSSQMNLIKSLAGKIKDDISHWEAAGQLPYRLRMYYNEMAEAVQSKLRLINQTIQERKPTIWELVGGFFRRLYRAVVELLPLMFQRLLTGNKQKFLARAA